jgi:hypothetical protein
MPKRVWRRGGTSASEPVNTSWAQICNMIAESTDRKTRGAQKHMIGKQVLLFSRRAEAKFAKKF